MSSPILPPENVEDVKIYTADQPIGGQAAAAQWLDNNLPTSTRT